ncbi:hypothetical protein U1Q18_015115 [Sarracenia purpurea var. burkii]
MCAISVVAIEQCQLSWSLGLLLAALTSGTQGQCKGHGACAAVCAMKCEVLSARSCCYKDYYGFWRLQGFEVRACGWHLDLQLLCLLLDHASIPSMLLMCSLFPFAAISAQMCLSLVGVIALFLVFTVECMCLVV